MIMSDLPPELIEEILFRVPATSLKRLRSTCKRWHALFKDRRFIQKHFRRATKESLVLMLKGHTVCSVSVNLNVAAPSLEFKVPLRLKDSHSISEQFDTVDVIHCDGLLLCTTTRDNRVVVWNPCLGETIWIQIKTDHKMYSTFALGHENNNFCHSYKILRWYPKNDKFDVFEIYEFSSDSWRVLDAVALDCFIESAGVSLKGDAYWLASDKTDKSEFLQSFDFKRERFRRLCLPAFQSGGCTALSVVREEQLSVIHQILSTPKMEVWVTNKIDTEAALWTKSFTVDLDSDSRCFYKIPTSFVIDEEKKLVVSCNVCYEPRKKTAYTIDKYYTELPFSETTVSLCPLIFSYVPSLVQIQQGRGNKRVKTVKKLVDTIKK